MTGPSRAEEGGALGEELRDARMRGIDYLDLDTRKQSPVPTPVLDRLAREYTGDAVGRRVLLIRQLFDETLTAWKERGYALEADFVRSLFFAADGSTPGSATSARRLMDVARRESGLGEDQFDDRRRAIFRDYAAFLLDYVEEHSQVVSAMQAQAGPEAEHTVVSDDTERTGWRPSPGLVVGLAFLLIIAGALITYALTRASGNSPQPSSPTSSTSPLSTTAAQASIKFDSLGSTASSIINVYPGPRDTPESKKANGTFRSGDVVPVTCKATGRTITSDPNFGETPRQSDQWVRIVGTPTVEQYATLTYADIDPQALATLPECEGIK